MKLKQGIVTHKVDQEYVTVFSSGNPDGFHGVLRSNATAHFIMECLKEDTAVEMILEKMQAAYNGDAEAMLEDINLVIGNLRCAGAIID